MKAQPYVIEKFRAFVAVDEDGNEGLCAAMNTRGEWMPLIAADEARFDSIQEVAQKTANATGMTIHVIEYTARNQIGILTPKK
jgi:hypothetical protein